MNNIAIEKTLAKRCIKKLPFGVHSSNVTIIVVAYEVTIHQDSTTMTTFACFVIYLITIVVLCQ